MAKDKYEPVVFLDSAGNEITNDPVVKARQTLSAMGVGSDERDAEIESLLQQLAALQESQSQSDDDEDDDESSDSEDEENGQGTQTIDLESMDGKQLKAFAGERNIDITGLTKVSEVRTRIAEALSVEN